MTRQQLHDTIAKAVKARAELILTVTHGLGELLPDTPFQGYLLGADLYQYGFVWGFLPQTGLYYKFMLDRIVTAKATKTKYAVRKDACYQFALEEEQFARLSGFDNIFGQAARYAGE